MIPASSLNVSFLTHRTVCQTSDMSQGEPGIELDTSLGYLLKAAASALHSALEAVLRPLGMTITHYACLELLAQRPGPSNGPGEPRACPGRLRPPAVDERAPAGPRTPGTRRPSGTGTRRPGLAGP